MCRKLMLVSDAGIRCWYSYYGMRALKKITVVLPADLVERATAATGKGITPTIREGLEAMAASQAYEGLRRLRGKVRVSLNLDELRQD